ncbi:ATP-binding cassette domain-containing protein [Nocardioides humi]|uniref:ABC transporter ATP-binding protein n=1 Tax=Nocardioides humi TaxID=449461 RepID=A0ABN1ZZQ9_9ACTN|nr:ATP-binding cassette domain-containing protein [Nocardioides humi]
MSAPSSDSPSSLDVRGCSKSFSGSGRDTIRALLGANLTVRPGELVAILGSNGAGKSTLMNVVAGGLVPDEGSVWVAGRDVTRWPSWRRARHLWTIRQDPEVNVMGRLTLEENLALAQAFTGRRRPLGRLLTRERRERGRAALAGLGMGLEDRLSSLGAELSGGQRQAVAVAMASVAAPTVLLVDEHAAALDPRSGRIVIAATGRLVVENRLACLMITHNLDQAVELADRVVIMHQGSIAADLRNPGRALTAGDLLARFEEATGGDVPDVVKLATDGAGRR